MPGEPAAARVVPPPAPGTGWRGLTCFVTWMVRRTTWVRTSGLAARVVVGLLAWLELRATPPSPPRPITAAPAATFRFMFLTTITSKGEFARALWKPAPKAVTSHR